MLKNAIILAAGKGTRMKTELPKCAYPVCGKAMVNHIIEHCKDANVDNIFVVVGYKKEKIKEVVKEKVTYIEQAEQLGTGHAIMCCQDKMANIKGITLIFPGDMPLIDSNTINEFVTEHQKYHNDLTVMTTYVDDPTGYGRIFRNSNGICKIIEEKEASEEVKKIKEVNTGLYCIDNELLFEVIKMINNNNNKGEYYLTDIIEILANEYKVDSYVVNNDYRLTGINDLDTLNKVELIFQQGR